MADPEARMAARRAALIATLRAEFATYPYWKDRPDEIEPALQAMGRVPRHRFVPRAERRHAYENRPLPIGHGQTISQPSIVAAMTALSRPGPQSRILEIGTGCGYQTAVLAELAGRVATVELIPELGMAAAELLGALGYRNVDFRIGDGWKGWPEHAPYDAILVAAAAPELPAALVEQLKPEGVLVLPVGPRHGDQQLELVRRGPDGAPQRRALFPVGFVPLVKPS